MILMKKQALKAAEMKALFERKGRRMKHFLRKKHKLVGIF